MINIEMNIGKMLRGPQYKIDMEYKNHEIKKMVCEGDRASLLTAVDILALTLVKRGIKKTTLLDSIFNAIECSDSDIENAKKQYIDKQKYKDLDKAFADFIEKVIDKIEEEEK